MAAFLALSVLPACSTNGVGDRFSAVGHDPAQARMLAEARELYARRAYGKASKLYEKSVELDAKSPSAWLGLAATYDQIGRFDLADKAYSRVTHLIGDTPQVLNNKGYSYLLRGRLDEAKHTLAAAYRGAPDDDHIKHNITLLNTKLAELGRPVVAVDFVE
ncbi:MAG: tetratricopeptide repeat protein [Pseudomonadota bacterium]